MREREREPTVIHATECCIQPKYRCNAVNIQTTLSKVILLQEMDAHWIPAHQPEVGINQ